MIRFAETLRVMIPFEQRAHSRLLTENEAAVLEGTALQAAKRTGYSLAQGRK